MTAQTGHSHFEATVLEVLVPGAAAPEVVVISEEVVTYLEAVEQGPAGALNTDFFVDPLAYYILAKN